MQDETSYFVRVLGDYPLIRVLDFLITFREFDYSLTDIAENASVAWSTLHEVFPHLIEAGIVRETRQIGRARLFKLDTENPIAQTLIDMDLRISKYFNDLQTGQKVAVSV